MKKLNIILAIVFVMAASCTSNNELPENPQIVGLASPINLELDTTTILTADFFIDPSLIDSVSSPGNMGSMLSPDRDSVILTGNLEKPLGVIKFWIDGYAHHILARKSNKENVTITFNPGGKNYRSVQVKGEFNSWNAASAPLQKNGNIWETDMLMN